MSESWSTLMGSIRYGYAPYYVMKIAGIPTLFVEVTGNAIAPTGYDLSPTLVIDKGARVGATPESKSNIYYGFDFEGAILSDSTSDPYFTRPTARTTLTSDITAAQTTLPVASVVGLTTATHLYFGNQTVANDGGYLWTQFQGLTRNTYQTPRSAKAGTVVADAPLQWLDREVTLYLVMMDPSGSFVQTANILDTACVVWQGHIQTRPIREQGLWRFTARDQARRLNQPLGSAGSGKVVFSFDDDSPLYVDLESIFTFRIEHQAASTTSLGEYSMRPFSGLTNPVRPSKLRERLQDYWSTICAPDADLGEMTWELVPQPTGLRNRRWIPTVEVTAPSTGGVIFLQVRMEGAFSQVFSLPQGGFQVWHPTVALTDRYRLPMSIATQVLSAGLSVIIEEGNPNDLPTSGFVRLEGNGEVVLLEYDNLTVDSVDGTTVHLSIVDMTDLDWAAQLNPNEDPVEYSATFLFTASGTIETVARSIIVSTGDAVNGTFDTLPRGAGYGIGSIDSDSFPTVFDGVFDTFRLNLTSEAGTSLAEQVGGLLRLSQRAIVGRRAADGSGVKLTAVHVGSPDAGAPEVTLTDADLVSSGKNPIRVVSTFEAPQIIKIEVKSSPEGTGEEISERLTIVSDWLSDWTQEQWDLKIYGVSRSLLIAPAQIWGLGIMRGAENRQVIEVDVAPWHDAQPGDNVLVSFKSANLWDYASGARGVTSLARCVGAQVSLDRGIQTLYLMVDGIWGGRPMSPSLPIEAVNGSATAPTSIDLDPAYLDLLTACAAYGPFNMKAYLPGEDAGLSDYTISGVALSGGYTRLTVSGYPSTPSVSLTTAYRLTFPVASVSTSTGNEVQLRHLHNTDIAQWS